jgi:sec-independent protein translocase protein TatB
MFDIGWSEMAVILLVALVVIGPKDLPKVARQIGKWSAKARSMARDFQRSIDDMAREAELDDIKNEIQKASRGDIRRTIEKAIDPDGALSRSMDLKSPPPPPVAAAASTVAPSVAAATAGSLSPTPAELADHEPEPPPDTAGPPPDMAEPPSSTPPPAIEIGVTVPEPLPEPERVASAAEKS